jgi:hypothetical protein
VAGPGIDMRRGGLERKRKTGILSTLLLNRFVVTLLSVILFQLLADANILLLICS